MAEWFADCIVKGTDGLNEKLTYTKVIKSIAKKLSIEKARKLKDDIDNILISRGRMDLIEKVELK